LPLTQLRPPKAVVGIARRLEEHGFETWCVGGAVRDALLGHPHLDWDLATAATPAEVRRLFKRTVPVGIEFGTVGVLDERGVMHEVTTFRRDVETDGRHAVVEFGASLDDDLARRDFTINAIAFSPTRDILHDPFDGRRDLDRAVVRAVGDPAARMREDRLRALRAIRFASRFAFSIDPPTWEAVRSSAPHLGRLSPERVKQELEKTMQQVEHPGQAMALWRESGAFGSLVPELSNISERTLRMLDQLPRAREKEDDARTRDRLTALFADLAPRDAARVLRALRFSNQQIAWSAAVLEAWSELHEEIFAALASATRITDGRPREWAARMGRTRVRYVFRLLAAERRAREAMGERVPSAEALAALYRRTLRSAFRDALELSDLAVSGDELGDAGIPPGPEVGRILRELLKRVIADPSLNTPDALLVLARTLHTGEQPFTDAT
jgi:tRNA nucleotidyltransferase (CCA-adding enzyme)